MTGPAHIEDEPRAQLDPAAERVRRKLVRFMGINLAILFAAVMAVVAAFVYKSVAPEGNEGSSEAFVLPGDGVLSGEIGLPASARILSHAVDGGRISLHLRLSDGAEEIRVYDMQGPRLVVRFSVTDQ